MKSVNIKLNLMTDGAKFVQIVGAYPYDMDLRTLWMLSPFWASSPSTGASL